MADLDVSGITDTIRQLNKADLFTDENLKEMLTAGADIMLEAVKSAFVEAGHNNIGLERRTGATYRHIVRRASLRRDKHGDPYMVVSVTGKDSRGQRYGAKAFALNYGRRTGGKIPADYYWSRAKQNAWPKVNAAMVEIAARKLKGE